MVWLVFTELLRNLLKLFLAGVLCYQWKQLLGELLKPRLPKIMVIRCFVNTPFLFPEWVWIVKMKLNLVSDVAAAGNFNGLNRLQIQHGKADIGQFPASGDVQRSKLLRFEKEKNEIETD